MCERVPKGNSFLRDKAVFGKPDIGGLDKFLDKISEGELFLSWFLTPHPPQISGSRPDISSGLAQISRMFDSLLSSTPSFGSTLSRVRSDLVACLKLARLNQSHLFHLVEFRSSSSWREARESSVDSCEGFSVSGVSAPSR